MTDNNDPLDGQDFGDFLSCANVLIQDGTVENELIELCQNGPLYPKRFLTLEDSGDDETSVRMSSPEDSLTPEVSPNGLIPCKESPHHAEVQNFLPTGIALENNQLPTQRLEIEFYQRDGKGVSLQKKNEETSKRNELKFEDLARTLNDFNVDDENDDVLVISELVTAPRYPKDLRPKSPTDNIQIYQALTPDTLLTDNSSHCQHQDAKIDLLTSEKPIGSSSSKKRQHRKVDAPPSREAPIGKSPRKRALKSTMNKMSSDQRAERKREQNKKNATNHVQKKKAEEEEANNMALLKKEQLDETAAKNSAKARRLHEEWLEVSQRAPLGPEKLDEPPLLNEAPNCIAVSQKLTELKKKVRKEVRGLQELKDRKLNMKYSAYGSQKSRKLKAFKTARSNYLIELYELRIRKEVEREERLKKVEEHLEKIRKLP